MIYELLGQGRENARTGRELAQALGCTLRDISAQVERERRDGFPICAATGDVPGYYLAADVEELETYCDRLKGRAIEVFKTRQALIRVLKQLQARQEAANNGTSEESDR